MAVHREKGRTFLFLVKITENKKNKIRKKLNFQTDIPTHNILEMLRETHIYMYFSWPYVQSIQCNLRLLKFTVF